MSLLGIGGRSDLPRGRAFNWRAPSFWILLVSCWVVYGVFVDKWPTNDDPLFLDYAERLTWNPTRCEVSDEPFQGRLVSDYIVFESTHPPLVPYWIKWVKAWFGTDLNVLHWSFLVFLVLSAWGMAALIARYTAFPPVLALGLVLGPLFLPFATGFMTDVPLFAFWVGAMWAWENYLVTAGKGRLHLVMVFLLTFAAVATAYQGLGLLVILLWRGRAVGKTTPAFFIALGVGCLFLLWLLLVWQHYGIFPYFDPPRTDLSIASELGKGAVWSNIWHKTQAMVLYWGAALGPFLILWLLRLGPTKWLFPLLSVSGWGLVWVWASPLEEKGLWPWGWVLAAMGLVTWLLLAKAIGQLRSWQDDRITPSLLLWAVGFLIFQMFFAALASPRYILLAFAALFLILLRTLPVKIWTQWGLYLGLFVQICMGFWVARSEYDYAEAQRLTNLDLTEFQSANDSVEVSVAGEVGIHYSTDQLGWRYYLRGEEDKVSYLLVPTEIDHVAPDPQLLAQAEVVKTFEIKGQTGIRVMNRAAEAGLYRNGHGLLPYAFSTEIMETYKLYRCYRQVMPLWQGEGDNPEFRAQVAGTILPDTPVSSEFDCAWDGLTRLKLNLATYARKNQSSLRISLRDLSGPLPVIVFSRELQAMDLADNSWITLDFDPIDSKDKRFQLVLSSPDATPTTAITIWTNSAADGVYYHGNAERQGRLKAVALCLPRQ